MLRSELPRELSRSPPASFPPAFLADVGMIALPPVGYGWLNMLTPDEEEERRDSKFDLLLLLQLERAQAECTTRTSQSTMELHEASKLADHCGHCIVNSPSNSSPSQSPNRSLLPTPV